MFNNPFYNPQGNIDRINNQIKELENLKNQYQTIPQPMQQPIQNIINTNNSQNIEFEARYLKKDEEVENIIVQRKTAFISPENRFLKVKEIDGTITTYELIPPLDEKDKKILELENKIKEMEAKNELSINKTNNDVKKSTTSNTKSNE